MRLSLIAIHFVHCRSGEKQTGLLDILLQGEDRRTEQFQERHGLLREHIRVAYPPVVIQNLP